PRREERWCRPTSCSEGPWSGPGRAPPRTGPARRRLLQRSQCASSTSLLLLWSSGWLRKGGAPYSCRRRTSSRHFPTLHRLQRRGRRLGGAVDLAFLSGHVEPAVRAERRHVDEPHVGRLLRLIGGEHRVGGRLGLQD